MPTMGTSTANTVSPLNIQVNSEETASCLNSHKASGPNQISPRFLKEMASLLAPVLTLIYQASYEQGQIPNDWKGAFVTLLFKKWDNSKAANYWPDLLTSYCCKVVEHIVHRHLMKCMENNKILSDSERGFRKRRSCEIQLITTIHDLAVSTTALYPPPPPPPPSTHTNCFVWKCRLL